jgi:hypothetical protein
MTLLNLWNPNYPGIAGIPQPSGQADTHAHLLAEHRDLRLDLVFGISTWFMFLDHIPHNVVNWITLRNFGFSGAADLFIFLSGYAAAMVYGKLMLERGFIVGATRIFKRVWQLYAAYVVLLVIYSATIGYVAGRFAAPDIIDEFNVLSLVDHPVQTLAHGLLLQSKALNLEVLQLYIPLMALFPPVLWALMHKPTATLLASFVLYAVARQFGWTLHSFPDGDWYFNPYCWQLLFVSGAWIALGGTRLVRPMFHFSALFYLAGGYLVFALVMTMAGRFPEFGNLFPRWLFDAFNPNDRSNMAPYRLAHFMILAFLMTRFVPRDWHGLKWPILQPVIASGQQSIAVFCVGVFLSFAGQVVLAVTPDAVLNQVLVSAAGIAIMTLVAVTISWSKAQDRSLAMPTHPTGHRR